MFYATDQITFYRIKTLFTKVDLSVKSLKIEFARGVVSCAATHADWLIFKLATNKMAYGVWVLRYSTARLIFLHPPASGVASGVIERGITRVPQYLTSSRRLSERILHWKHRLYRVIKSSLCFVLTSVTSVELWGYRSVSTPFSEIIFSFFSGLPINVIAVTCYRTRIILKF